MGQRTVVLELAGNDQLARDLVAGGLFVPGEVLPLGEECVLVLRAGGAQLVVAALCVWVDRENGSGLQLVGCGAEMKQQIRELAENAAAAGIESVDEPALDLAGDPELEAELEAAALAEFAVDQAAALAERAVDQAAALAERGANQAAALAEFATDAVAGGLEADDGAGELAAVETTAAGELVAVDTTAGELAAVDTTAASELAATDADRKIALNVHERLRGLTLVQQIKVAQHGEVSERIVLERMYGKNVWEALLRNPRLTGPEVARIARMGALPRPLIEIIVGNGAWLQIPEVRRALLTNPRLATDQILRVLRLLPKHELKLAGMQTAYPFAVRAAAKKMLRELGG
jgi:hypothetical protein